MIAWMALLKKEFKIQWAGPLNYVLIGLFMLLMGTLFFQTLLTAKAQGQAMASQVMARTLLGNLNSLLLFVSTLVTMRSLSEEQRRGTLDLLMLGRLTPWKIWSCKFLASLSVLAVMVVLSLIFPLIIYTKGDLDWTTVFIGHGGTLLNLGFYVAVGILASSLTDHQILAALISFVSIILLLLLSWVGQNSSNVLLSQIFQYLSPSTHLQSLAFGQVRSFGIFYYVSGIFLLGFMTVRRLELRRI